MASKPKPFLKKRSGFTGRFVDKIHYPHVRHISDNKSAEKNEVMSNSPERSSSPNSEKQQESSPLSISDSEPNTISPGNKVMNSNRPFTAGTVDSGCQEDAYSVILSPGFDVKDDYLKSVVIDVTEPSCTNSAATSGQSNFNVPSVIHDMPEFSSMEMETVSAKSKSISESFFRKGLVSPGVSLMNNSTAEFERFERFICTPKQSQNSQDSDGTSSRHWKQVIKDFGVEASKKLEIIPHESFPASTESLATTNSTKTIDQIAKKFPIHNHVKKTFQKKPHKQLHAMREAFPSILEEKSGHGLYACVKKIENGTEKPKTENAPLLQKSVEKMSTENKSVEQEIPKSTGISVTEQNLAKQLRDLIAHLDIASENRHYEHNRFQEIVGEVLQENEFFCQRIDALKKRIAQLEKNEETRKEDIALKEEIDKLQKADIERLKKENATLNRQQKKKSGNDSDFVNLLKEQITDLRAMLRDFERQRSEWRTQMRKNSTLLKEKTDLIEQLKEEKTRLEKRLIIVSNTKAALRGRQAENAFSTQAIARASRSAAVTTATKNKTSQNNDPVAKNVVQNKRNIFSELNKNQEAADAVKNKDIINDNEDINFIGQTVEPSRFEKNVRWNDPLTTLATFTPPAPIHPSRNLENSDMELILTENNMIGRASLYRSENDFTVYTLTHCGCNFYEYSNTDTRWMHSSNLYQVNYFGQAGATTVEIAEKKLLVRHFLSGQLEIYRESGETSLVTSAGRRIEVMRHKSGAVRVEIYELNGTVRVRGRGEAETLHRATQTSCHRMDGSYAFHILSDDSIEWRSPDYTVHRFKNGDTKVRLNAIDTSITMLVMDVGTVKHLSNTVDRKLPKYCVEWGTIARKRSRVIANNQSRVLNQL
ncbi:unnamed protein product [Thelazia callipaeda]|uniref:Centromere protein J n=1 Tax=Thelazia callipaeda TaxID=103827 RepID=A0A0N5CMY4_THECL|nr:unnamed protein product [Thelazia callipaeda]